MTASLDDLFASSDWWAALRLDERAPASAPGDPAAVDRGQRRLALWRAEKRVTGGVEVDLSRWQRLGIAEDRLAALLGETTESLRHRVPEQPGWLTTLAEAYAHAAGPRDELRVHGQVADPTAPPPESFGLLELIWPLGQHHHELLRKRLAEMQRAHGNRETIADDHPVLRPNLQGLAGMITTTLVREMHAKTVAGDLAGDTSQARFESFVESLRDPVTAVRILLKYPVLAREVVEELATWVRVRAAFADRLLTDLPELVAAFGVPNAGLAGVADVSFGAGDTHDGGQNVAIVEFTNGHKVVYKPRSVAVERHFYELTDWLDARGLTYPLRSLDILNRGEYGWVEHVAEGPCTDTEQAARFFWRQGACLALLYTLRAQDMHLENLIAAGEHPVFVDLEAVFQAPPAQLPSLGAVPVMATRLVGESVLGVGVLPQRILRPGADGPGVLDMSGLTGAAGELTPMPLPHWLHAGTDEMRIARGHLPMGGSNNLAKVGAETADPNRFRAELQDGFENAYQILLINRDELSAPDGPLAAFERDRVRPILRATMIYARLLLESWHPDVLRDGLDRACLFEVLAKGHKEKAARWEIVDSECQQILERDVPSYYTLVGSEHLYDRSGVVVENFFPMSGMASVGDKLAGLSDADLRQQLWCIEASLNAAQIGDLARDGAITARPLAVPGIDDDIALRAASRLGDELVDTALREPGTGRPAWLSLNLIGERYWNIAPTGFESFTGLTGIALFLAHLSEAGGDARYRADAEVIAEQLVDQVAQWSALDSGELWPLSIGAFGELGGSIYTLAHLGALWRSDVLLKTAAQLVPLLTARFADDKALDVISGTAGAALSLLALHEVSPDDHTEQALVAAGETLLAAAETHDAGSAWTTTIGSRRPLLGFSHGASGFAVALARLARTTGRGQFADAAAAAVRYEHAQFDPVAGNWPDERDITPPGVFMNAWCHGAAGVGIARAELAGELDIPEVMLDLRAAVSRVEHDLIKENYLTGIGNDSICHGDLGLAETLLSAGPVLGRPELVNTAGRVARTIAEWVLAGEVRCGVPKGMHTPGLMMGVAGIGYGLLRAAAPDRVPNVLAVAAPVRAVWAVQR